MVRCPCRTICAGMSMKLCRNVANFIARIVCFSDSRRLFQRPFAGCTSANEAFRLQAREAITMYAQLATRVFTGARNARTPELSCAMRFSWLQRLFASNTMCSAGSIQSFVM